MLPWRSRLPVWDIVHYFCINLSASTQRRRSMESQLRRLGLDYSFVSAIDGKALPESSFLEFSDVRYQRRIDGMRLSGQAIGRALSHMKAYRKMLEAGHGHAVVLEDDVILDRDIDCHVEDIARTMASTEPEIVLLSPIGTYFIEGMTMIDRYQVVDVAAARLAWGYLINARAARLLMQRNFPVRFVADDWDRVRYNAGCRIRGVLPALISAPFTKDGPGVDTAGAERDPHLRQLRSRILRLPIELSRWWRGVFRRQQSVTPAQARLRRPPLTPVPTTSGARAARD